MSAALDAWWAYWQAGGPLMPALAACGLAVWWIFLHLRERLLAELDGRPGGVLDRLRPAALTRPYTAACETETAGLRREVTLLKAVNGAAPLLGLLGTVLGMMDTFRASSAGSAHDLHALSAGISQALITTQVGLLMSIPGVFGAARCARLLRSLRLRLDQQRAEAALAAVGAGA